MKKLIIKIFCAMLLFVATSCVDDLTSLNQDPKAYQSGTVPEGPFFSNATRNLTDALVEGMNFKIWAQQFAETTYFTTSNYTLTNPGNGFWVALYQSVLNDYAESKKILLETPSLYPGVDKNKLAMIEIMEVFTYAVLVNTFGDIPYSGAVNESLKSEALDTDNTTPSYDDAVSIYDDLFVRLDNAIADLDPNADNGGVIAFGDADLIFNDDVGAWVKFANSLKLRMAMTLADSNPTKAKELVESIDPADLFQSSADNAELQYLATTPNTNPIWVWLVQSGRQDYVASNTMLDLMLNTSDPRIPLYYTKDDRGIYSGGKYGAGNSFATFSKAGDKVTSETWPGILMDYSEVEFYLAEAAAKSFAVSGTAEEHYNNAIAASMEYWGVEDIDYHMLTAVAIKISGSGYVKNDVLTVTEGTFTNPTEFIVSEVSAEGGKIVALSIKTPGEYSVPPAGELTVTGGTGTGASFEGLYIGGINTYLDDPDVAYTTAQGTAIEKIARQKYIAMFNRGFEAWVDYRRLDYPVFNVPPNPGGPFPIRYTYPNSEQTSNGENYTAAAAAIGGDELTTKIFWDID